MHEFRYVVYLFNDTCMADGLRYEVYDTTMGWPKCGLPVGAAYTEALAEDLGKAAVRRESAVKKTIEVPRQE